MSLLMKTLLLDFARSANSVLGRTAGLSKITGKPPSILSPEMAQLS